MSSPLFGIDMRSCPSLSIHVLGVTPYTGGHPPRLSHASRFRGVRLCLPQPHSTDVTVLLHSTCSKAIRAYVVERRQITNDLRFSLVSPNDSHCRILLPFYPHCNLRSINEYETVALKTILTERITTGPVAFGTQLRSIGS